MLARRACSGCPRAPLSLLEQLLHRTAAGPGPAAAAYAAAASAAALPRAAALLWSAARGGEGPAPRSAAGRAASWDGAGPLSRGLAADAAASGGGGTSASEQKITVTFVDRDGERITVKVPVDTNLLEAAHANDIDLEGACEGSLACSTCHVIVEDPDMFARLPEPNDDENDMLDLAFGLTATSRLGCQVIAKPELDGLVVRLPQATRNFAVDGFVPKPH